MTVEDCRELLKNNVDSEFYCLILKRIEELENEAFNRCSTISACKDYIRLFPEGRHRASVSEIVDDLYFKKYGKSKIGCKHYLNIFHNGKHIVEAQKRIKHIKKLWIAIFSCLLTFIILGYRPAWALKIIGNTTLQKVDGETTLTISTMATPPYISCSTSYNNWLDCEYAPYDHGRKRIIHLSYSTNYGRKRSADLRVSAYSSLFGIKLKHYTYYTTITQNNGEITHLSISPEIVTVHPYDTIATCKITCDGNIANDRFIVKGDDWINFSYNKTDKILSIHIKDNDTKYYREGSIDYLELASIQIKQSAYRHCYRCGGKGQIISTFWCHDEPTSGDCPICEGEGIIEISSLQQNIDYDELESML